ncbi:hypothetical protein ABZT51_47800 [Streptomyces sp. NPDC005373]|uniref:hypothetical protein n=1 Tax=Streptomyces sp. NPDC005373 TaxID=3156879 RepID=UPI0033BDC7AD
MTMPRELTRTEWTAFHTAYQRGNAALCPSCQSVKEAVLKPLDRIVRFSCGHELAIPENTDPLAAPQRSAR